MVKGKRPRAAAGARPQESGHGPVPRRATTPRPLLPDASGGHLPPAKGPGHRGGPGGAYRRLPDARRAPAAGAGGAAHRAGGVIAPGQRSAGSTFAPNTSMNLSGLPLTV